MLRLYIAKIINRLSARDGLPLMVMAVLVGAATGLAAVFFIRLISFIHTLAYTEAGNFPVLGRWWFVIIPVLGALISGPIIAYFANEAKGHGIPEVMQALILRGGRIRPRVAIAKIAASALCIGTGGSAGREGPIVQVGSALGSSLGQWLCLPDDKIKNLVACGAAAGIAATFNAPIAGVIFATEVLLTELQVAIFGNVVLAAVSASIVSRIFLGARPAFEVPSYVLHSPWEILLYVVLGVLAALTGVFFIRLLSFTEDLFDNWKFPLIFKPAIGALLLGLLAYSYPHLSGMVSVYPEETRLGMPLLENMPHVYGSGFPFMDDVLQGRAPLFLLAMLVILKPLATSLTLGSGNSGGVFAPSLFTGAVLGGAFGHLAMRMFPGLTIEVGSYALVGMAAVFAAAARAPLTSMLIVFEMSNDYHLILPLMAAGIVASTLAQWLYKDSIYTVKLTKKGIHFESDKATDVMQGVIVDEVMNRKPVTVNQNISVAEFFAYVQGTHLQGFPVMSDDKELCGIVTLQDVEITLQHMERTLNRKDVTLKDVSVWDVATPDPVTVFPDDPIWSAIRKMAPRELARLPVVSRQSPHKLVGLISRSDILRAYDVAVVRKHQAQHFRDRMALRKMTSVEFIEIKVKANSAGAAKRLADIKLPANTNIISIERRGSVMIPNGDTTILAGDLATVLCRIELIADVRRVFEDEI